MMETWQFQGDAERVYDCLMLFRVQRGNTVTTLVAARSYSDACQEVKLKMPNIKASVWNFAGPANDHNMHNWKLKVINPEKE